MNLHHFLYHAARNGLRGEEKLSGRVRISNVDRAVELSGDEAVAWHKALQSYAELGAGDLLFDSRLRRIRETLILGEDAMPPSGADRDFDALRAAMPIYRRHWWPAHERSNRARITELSELLGLYGASMSEQLAKMYQASWPDTAVRVDVSAYGGRHGAYTVSPPDHIVLASGADWYPGLYGLEILFHEAGHLEAFEADVVRASKAGAMAAGVKEERAWHAFLFYVSAQAARRAFPEPFEPYPWRYGLFTGGSMSRHLPYIEMGLAAGDSLAEVFRILHAARVAAGSESTTVSALD